MKQFVPLMLLFAGMFAAGCASNQSPKSPAFSQPVGGGSAPVAIITPDDSVAGKVVLYNSDGRFAVLNFPDGRIPAAGQTLFLYHLGLKAAVVKITGPQIQENIVADLIAGVARVGDEVRNQ